MRRGEAATVVARAVEAMPMRPVELGAAYSDPIEMAAAYNELVDYTEALLVRERQLVESVRILRKKYATAQAECAELLWTRVVGEDLPRLALPPAVAGGPREGEGEVGRYALGATVGAGSSAVVRACVDTATGATYACKVVDKAKVTRFKTLRALSNEIELSRAARHPNIANLVDAIQTETKLYLVLEHGGRDLYALLYRAAPCCTGAPAAPLCGRFSNPSQHSTCSLGEHDGRQ